jgi:hypothetical protein
MKRLVVFACIVLRLCCSSLSAQTANQPLDVCDLIAHAADYDGKTVYVRGLWRMTPHGSLLMRRSCAEAAAVKQTSDYKADHSASAVIRKITKNDQFAAVEVVFRGVFKAARQGQCFGELCMAYEVETDELVSAQAPPS